MQLYESEFMQDETEFSDFGVLLQREKIRSYLEIGSKFGGSLWRIAQYTQPGARMVAVDMPNGTKRWHESSASLKACVAKLKEFDHDAHIIWGDSTAEKTVEAARALGPFDLIMIDANHTMPFVKADWKNYGPMGRMIAFHDIGWRRAQEWVGVRIDVPQFWNSIKGSYRHVEFRSCPTGKNNGIGVLWRA